MKWFTTRGFACAVAALAIILLLAPLNADAATVAFARSLNVSADVAWLSEPGWFRNLGTGGV